VSTYTIHLLLNGKQEDKQRHLHVYNLTTHQTREATSTSCLPLYYLIHFFAYQHERFDLHMNNCFQWYECRLDLVVYNTTLTYKERLQQAHSLIQ